MLDRNQNHESPIPSQDSCLPYLEDLRQNGEQIVLMIGGKAEFVVQDEQSYQRLCDLVDRLETIEAIHKGLRGMESGQGRPADEVLEEIRHKHPVPPDA